MDGSIFVFILSTIVTIVVTWYFTWKQMRKNEITHFSISSYDVGKGLHDEFPKFHLTYDDTELSNELLILKGGFINSGRNDITDLDSNSDIKLILPENCDIKDVIVKKISDDVEVTASVDKDNKNIISFSVKDKFMSSESFGYSVIIDAKNAIPNLDREISFKHRIPNTSKICKTHLSGMESYKNDNDILTKLLPFRMEFTMGLFCLIISVAALFSSLSYLFTQKVSCSVYESNTGKTYSLYITPQSDLYISDNEVFPFFDKKLIKKENLQGNYELSPRLYYEWDDSRTKDGIYLSVPSLFLLAFSIYFFYLWKKKRHLYKLFEQYEKV